MRWSLILSAFTILSALSSVCVALVIPPSEVDLERRTNPKASSKTYRKNAEDHDYAYKFDKTGAVTREKLKPQDRSAHGKKMLMIPKTDADHVFEHQMLHKHLEKHGLHFDKLDPKLQDRVKSIINGPENMAPVPAGVNRGKGQVIKQGMTGKALKHGKKSRDEYTLLSYGTARKTAKELDKAFKDHGHNFGRNTFHHTLRTTMKNAGILKPGQHSPAGSSKSSSAGSTNGSVKKTPRKSFVAGKLPTRSSARIASNKTKKATGKKATGKK